MKILICGAGNVADEVLKRLSDQWQVTLIDKTEARLGDFSKQFVSVVQVISGDASSPVVLEEAAIEDQDYVLALTEDDRINLAVASRAVEKNVKNVISLVHHSERLAEFTSLGIWTVPLTSFIARMIYRYLQDPRMNVLPVGQGQAELLEIEISPSFMAAGKALRDFQKPDRQIVGLVREDQLLFPDPHTTLMAKDRLLILGKPDLLKDVCSELECTRPNFPLMYGQEVVLAIPFVEDLDGRKLLNEGIYLAHNTKTHRMFVLCEKGACRFREDVERWSESLDIEVRESEERATDQIRDICARQNVGVVVLPPMKGSFFKSLKKPTLISLAHSLPCPLLIGRGSNPYESILVPFDGSTKAERSLEVAIDLSQQLRAKLTVVVVEEPAFLHVEEPENENGAKQIWERIRHMAHVHKVDIEEKTMAGNPVREISETAKQFGLMVIASSSQDKELLSPHVGESLIQQVPCSVLIVTD